MVKLSVKYDHYAEAWFWKVELNGTEDCDYSCMKFLALWKAKRAIKRIAKTNKFLEEYSGKA